MQKIYYNAKGWVCQRYPYDIPIEDKERYIEVDDTEYNKTMSTPIFFAWRVVGDRLVNEEYDDLTPEQIAEKQRFILDAEIEEHKRYLADTDYVITKLNEAQSTGDEEWLAELRTEYADIIAERKRRRELINELEKQ